LRKNYFPSLRSRKSWTHTVPSRMGVMLNSPLPFSCWATPAQREALHDCLRHLPLQQKSFTVFITARIRITPAKAEWFAGKLCCQTTLHRNTLTGRPSGTP
jgi:hypothetical protein